MLGLARVILGFGLGADASPEVPLLVERVRPLRAHVLVDDRHDHAHGDERAHAPGADLGAGPHDHEGFEHHHASPLGTPQVHGFLTEPAFLGRDVLVHAAFVEDETEIEIEVEWALSERALVVVGVPYVAPDEGDDEVGPVEAAFRWRLRERDRWVLSVQGGVEVPAGDDQAAALGASLLGWLDLGRDVTLQGNLGLAVEPEEGEWSVPFASALVWTTPLRSPFTCPPACGHQHDAEPHLSLVLEVAGAVPFEGEAEAQALAGAVFPLTRSVEVRVAWTRTIAGEGEGDSGIVVGMVVHF